MSALGQFLLEQRWLQAEELTDALHIQQELGGRLGTCLIERGYLSEELLLRALAEQQQAPTANASDLGAVPADIIALLPTKLASRHLAIPFRALGNQVDVALARIDNLAQIDELAFAVGKKLRPHVAVEARLYHALEHYYRVPCPQRFRRLIATLDQRRLAEPTAEAPPMPSDARPLPSSLTDDERRGPRRFVPGLRAPDKRSIPLTDDERRALEPALEPGASPPPSSPRQGESLGDRLASARSPAEIGELVLAAMDHHFVHSLIFRVSRRLVTGWLGHGPGLDRDWLASYSVALRQMTVFRLVDESGPFRGQLASSPAHDSLSRSWGGGLEAECLVVPVRVRSRLIAALYGDRGKLGLGDLEESAIEALGAKAGLAFERLILDRKLHG